MAIKDYIRPMLEVYQQLEVTQFEVGDKMAACIVGADYDLYRYGYETITPTPFALVDGSMTVPLVYERIPSLNYKLDTATITTYGEDMLAKVGKNPTSDNTGITCTVSAEDLFVVRTPAALTADDKKYFAIIETDTDKLTAQNAALVDVADASSPYSVQVGDTIIFAADGATDTTASVVVDLVGEAIPATTGTASVVGMTATANLTGTYALAEDTTLLLTVTFVNGNTVGYTITDTEGLMVATSGVSSSTGAVNKALGTSGITLETTITGASIGAYIAIPCTAASVSTTKFDGIRLATVAAPVDTDASIDCYVTGAFKSYTGELTGWTQEVIPGAHVNDDPELQLTGTPALIIDGKAYPFYNNEGLIYPSYRVMIQPQDTEDKYTITSIADIQKYFGTIAVENDLAYACYCALEGSAGRQLYALRVTDNTPAAYTAALNKVETDASTYNFCVLSQDRAIIEAATAYVTKRSEPDFKRWCRVLVGVDTPGAYVVAAKDLAGVALKADFGMIVNSKTEATYVMQLASGMNLDLLNLSFNGGKTQLFPGDQIENALTGEKWTIVEVKNATTVTLAGGPAGQTTKALPIRIWKADTPINAGEFVASLAEGLNMRRCSLVWSDKAVKEIDGKFTVMPNKYLAATVAGIGSAVVPQAPITHTEITTIDSAVRMYTKYTQKDLDNIAKDGVLIITQDAKNLPCYIRHQLTTETDKGVMYYEESCTRNLDNISYAVVDILEKYIGRANVTPSALRAIKVDMISVLNSFMDDSPSDLIGPSLINWDKLSIKQDTVFKDRVIVNVDLYLPLPLNNIKVYEMAYIADVTID